MLRKISVGVLALAVAGFASSAMAVPVNPWAPGQTTVPITVTVQPMVELFTDTSPVALTIADAGENQNSVNAVAKTLFHLHNVAVDISASIDSNIPTNTQFFILIDPATTWATRAAAATSKAIGWRYEGGLYSGVTGAFPNQVSAPGINSPVLAFSSASNSGIGSSDPAAQKKIQYFADAGNVMPNTGATSFNVVWTIAPN